MWERRKKSLTVIARNDITYCNKLLLTAGSIAQRQKKMFFMCRLITMEMKEWDASHEKNVP